MIKTISDSSADAWLVQETNLNWLAVPPSDQWQERWPLISDQRSKTFFGWNTHEASDKPHLPGGVGIIIKGKHIGRCGPTEKDPRKLGRWVSTKLAGRRGKVLRMVSAYRPVLTATQGPATVAEQQRRVLEKEGVDEKPRQILLQDLGEAIKGWHAEGNLVVLGMDANQNIRSEEIKQFALDCGLKEAILSSHPSRPSLATCVKNKSGVTIDRL